MANKTRGGIYYDLKESEYFVEIKGVKFFFQVYYINKNSLKNMKNI